MKKAPFVSIIIPVYNTAKFLPRCLDSVIRQTYRNLEIIIVDDGSTDNSYDIAKQYTQKDPRIKLIHQKNQGLSGARNTGITKSTGTYLTFIDSDDEIKPTFTEKLLTALQKNNAGISICSFKEVYPNGKNTHFSNNYPAKIYDAKSALQAMLQENGFMLSATMKLFPKAYFKNIRFPVGRLHEDVGTTYKLIMQADKTSFIPDELYIYHHHNNSIVSAKNFDPHKLDIITLTDQMCNDIDHKYPDLKNVTNERRMRARFSILRQIPPHHSEVKNIINYLKIHRSYIIKNPTATKADKIALKLALISPRLFQIAYKLFK
ncbi:MAG: glycosyltransferase [Candidatus Saccharimonadaceae bacterium]|nr:glycosyltransferase [Candidatus Saccharimonadaceae bacterium]